MAIFTFIGTAIAGALFAGSAIAATLISGVLAFGASLAFSYLKRPKKRSYTAVQGETKYGGDVDVEALYGVGKTKGQRTFYAKWGAGNKVNAEVFVLSDGWCDGLEPYCFAYGEKKDLFPVANIGGEAAHYRVAGFGSAVSIRFYDGRPGQVADMKLVNDTANLGNYWKSSSTNAGKAYVVVERTYDSDLFDKGKPDFEFVLRGVREYDPRKDSTVVGGSGLQRINDPATWVHTKNPAVHRLNYQLGLRALISGRTLIGEGKSVGQLDLPTYFAAMNVCDTVKGGKRTYECSLWVTGSDDHTEILKEFDDAMAGYGLNRRGLSGVIAGAPQIPVAEITAADIDVGRSSELQFRKSAFERFNHLSGQFMSIADNWNPQSLKPIYVNADIAADGRNRQASNDFLQVTDPDIAQYLLTIRYRQNRMGGTATVPVSRRLGLQIQEGEWVTYAGREWMISEWACDESFDITLTLSETSAGIYDDDDIEPGPVVIPPTPPVNPSIITTVSGFRIETGLIQGSDGFEQPTVRFIWDPPGDPTITQVRFEYRINGKTIVYTDASNEPEKGSYETSKDVQSGVIYDARATITTVPDRFRTFTPWVTSLSATGYSSIRSSLASIGADVRSVFTGLGNELDDLRLRLEESTAASSLSDAVAQVDRQKMRRELGAARAEIYEEKRVRVSESEALAETLTALSASFGENFAEGLVSFKAVASPTDVLVRFAIMLRAGTDEDFTESGFYIQIRTVGGVQVSEVGFLADKFTILTGDGALPVFAVDDGIVKIINAQIAQAQIENLVVGTSNIAPGAITSAATAFIPGFGAGSGQTTQTETMTVTHGLGAPPVILWGEANFEDNVGGTPRPFTYTIQSVTDGVTLRAASGSGSRFIATTLIHSPPADRAATTYRITVSTASFGSFPTGATLVGLATKR